MFLIEQKETRKQWTIKAIYNYKSAVTACRQRTPLVRYSVAVMKNKKVINAQIFLRKTVCHGDVVCSRASRVGGGGLLR